MPIYLGGRGELVERTAPERACANMFSSTCPVTGSPYGAVLDSHVYIPISYPSKAPPPLPIVVEEEELLPNNKNGISDRIM
jgi:hypothetical protein